MVESEESFKNWKLSQGSGWPRVRIQLVRRDLKISWVKPLHAFPPNRLEERCEDKAHGKAESPTPKHGKSAKLSLVISWPSFLGYG